jgi:endonuclease/exonuclease/phosphatase family metal-dependent hydrolase
MMSSDRAARPARQGRLRVVTWNVGRLYTPSHNNRLDDADVPRVARTLTELEGDVVLLQELRDERQLRGIVDGARALGYIGELAAGCGYDRHVAILVRHRLGPAFEHHVLAPTPRGVAAATFSVGDSARALVMAVHLDVFAKPRRRVQIEALTALTDERDEQLVVLAGDFNLDPAWAAGVGDALDAGSWALLASRFTDAGRAAGPTLLGLLRVDHVLARGPLASAVTRVSPRRLPLGDHDPVVCDLELGAPPKDGDTGGAVSGASC